jgi:uncharacterized protein (DUF305 family)
LLTLAVSFIVMYVVMYLNTYGFDHVCFSLTHFYMTVLIVTAMAVVMLLMMVMMYPNKTRNGLIMGASLTLFVGVLLLRSQTFVDDTCRINVMIPHQSIAILPSERATIKDPAVRQLAYGIITTQKREIAEMKALIERLEER